MDMIRIPVRVAWTLAAVALLGLALALRLMFPVVEAAPAAGLSPAGAPAPAPAVAGPPARAPAEAGATGDVPVATRPADVSEMEWQVLQGVAARASDPPAALARLVGKLRFARTLEQYRAPGAPAATRAALAARLLAVLPARVAAGDYTRDQALALQRELIAVLEPDPAAAAARAAAEAARLPGRVLAPVP